MRVTPQNLAKAVNNLPKDQWFDYIGEKSTGKVKVVEVVLPNGPVKIQRYNLLPKKQSAPDTIKKITTISYQMLLRVANAIQPGVPINIDRVLGASYNTRSALETLLAYTPEFYWCLPGRIEMDNSTSSIKRGHKHIIWRPENPHNNAISEKFDTDLVISEIPTVNAVYEALTLPETSHDDVDIDVARRHLQIQIALIMIGRQLGYRTWIAHNDKGFKYGDKKIGELEGIVQDLRREKLLMSFEDAISAGYLIDVIWFNGDRSMPAVIEVEHSTGVTSGLTRMKNFQDRIPQFPTRWVIVAADEDREKVYKEANKPQFKSLNVKFMPYSAVEELYSLLQRRHVNASSVNETFLNHYMESCLN